MVTLGLKASSAPEADIVRWSESGRSVGHTQVSFRTCGYPLFKKAWRMDAEMLRATQEAAWAAQSAAEAAWWALVVNGAVVVVAVATTFFQEWRVRRRVDDQNRALHQGAVDTVRQGWVAIDEAARVFYSAGEVQRSEVGKRLKRVRRARKLIDLFTAREVDPKILIGLLQMDDHLDHTENVLVLAIDASLARDAENAEFNEMLNEAQQGAELIHISLA